MKTTLKKEKAFFLNYVSGFLDDDLPSLNENIILKREHSLRVMKHCLDIADSLGFERENRELTGILGLFHDIGRFKQYRDYNTFSDKDSVYHGDLGIEVLKELNRFIRFYKREIFILKAAIHNHGLPSIENQTKGDELLFSKIIRDADKMDIFYIVDAYYREMLKGKRNIALELGLSNENKLTPKVFEGFMSEQIILKSDMNYINDFKLLQVAWVFDLNFEFTKRYLRNTCYIENIISQINYGDKQQMIRDKAFSYLKKP